MMVVTFVVVAFGGAKRFCPVVFKWESIVLTIFPRAVSRVVVNCGGVSLAASDTAPGVVVRTVKLPSSAPGSSSPYSPAIGTSPAKDVRIPSKAAQISSLADSGGVPHSATIVLIVEVEA